MKLAAYCRVSTDEQAERGTIETQRAEIRTWAAKRPDCEITFFEDAGWSGTTALETRPSASQMVRALAAKQFDGLVVWKLDRLARDPAIFLPLARELERRGLALLSVTEAFDMTTAAGEMSSTMLSAVSRYERRMIIERSIAGQNRVAREGQWLGGIVPYGYRLVVPGRMLRVSDDLINGLTLSEADVVRHVFKRCTGDGWGTYRIADELNAMRVPPAYARDERETSMGDIGGTRAKEGKRLRRTAGTWSGGAVNRMLRAEIYSGVHRFGRSSKRKSRELIARDMPPIVTPALFERAKQQLRANLRFAERNSKRDYALRGLLTCAGCGHSLVGCHYRTKDRDVLQYTCASHPKGERPPRIWAEPLEATMWSDIKEFVEHPNAVLRKIVADQAHETTSEGDAEKGLLRTAKALEEIIRQEKRALDFALQQIEMTPGVLEQKLAELRARKTALETELGALRQKRARAATSSMQTRSIRTLLGQLAKTVRRATPSQRAAAFRMLVKSVTIERRGNTHRVAVTYAFGSTEHASAVAITSATDRCSSPAACRELRRRGPRRR